MNVHWPAKPWPDIVDFFLGCEDANALFRPMRRLVEHVAQRYGSLLFATTSMHALLVAQHSEIELGHDVLRVELQPGGWGVRFEYQEQAHVPPSSWECPSERVIETFDGFVRSNRWVSGGPDLGECVRAVLWDWDRGNLSGLEVMDRLLDLVSVETVDEMMSLLNDEWHAEMIEKFRGYRDVTPETELISIFGGIYMWELERDPEVRARLKRETEEERAREQALFREVTIPAIQKWLAENDPTDSLLDRGTLPRVMSVADIEKRLLVLIDCCEELVDDERIEFDRELARAGEPGIALESLCDRLHDEDATVPADLLAEIRALGEVMKVDEGYWRRLAERPGRSPYR